MELFTTVLDNRSKIDTNVTYIDAGDLTDDDTLVNVGRVLAVSRVGVFIVAQVTTFRPSLATGKIERVTVDYVRHETDQIAISVG